jgi:PTH1 family peptidyl-tRNA hydrolase
VFHRKAAPLPASDRWLVIGLGNPGPEYRESRHNIGFMVVDELARQQHAQARDRAAKSHTGRIRLAGHEVVLGKPQTMMNLSGLAAKALRDKYAVPLERTLVVYDEIDLPFGRLRMRRDGSSAGHHGIDSLINAYGTKAFARLRVGVGRPAGDAVHHVLGPFTRAEREALPALVSRAADAVTFAIEHGIDRAMTEFNRT